MKTFSDFRIETGGKTGEIATTCPECSPSRKKKLAKCLSVNTDKGLWVCNHCGWSGTLKNGGIKTGTLHWNKPEYRKPEAAPRTDLPEKAKAWLASRGITEDVWRRNKIGFENAYMPQIEDHTDCMIFPFFRNGELINNKYRDFQKNFRQTPGAEQILYGLDDLQQTTLLVEGELDKLSFEVAGFKNVVSVPAGAPSEKAKDYSSKFSFLNDPVVEKVQKWIIAVDNDGPGKVLEAELARRLGHENCSTVTWPEGSKDANDVLTKHGSAALKEILKNAKPYPVEGIFSLADVSSQVDRILEEGWPKGISTGWRAVDEFLTIWPGQLTVVTGIPSHGKSEFIDALALNLTYENGWKFGVFSPENSPLENHCSKLIEKFIGARLGPDANRSMYQHGKEWVQEHFRFIIPDDSGLDN
ncbi:MAG TPA: toprim domain-containing protein, partial [Nitrospiria bacterium]|nr:toprim domain-containing protein [Nitrospiria bacterium]